VVEDGTREREVVGSNLGDCKDSKNRAKNYVAATMGVLWMASRGLLRLLFFCYFFGFF
jgi:hypothetical protein